jgi:HPr kinase/phosphorylase
VGSFYQEKQKDFNLKLISGEKGFSNKLTEKEVNRLGLVLAGFFDYFIPTRVQILGRTEVFFLKKLGKNKREEILEKLFSYSLPCLVVAAPEAEIPTELKEKSIEKQIPLFQTSFSGVRIGQAITWYLEDKFAPRVTLAGSLLEVYGIGVLILGKAGVGKSECALALIERGHRLISDDAVNIKKTVDGVLLGTCSEVIKHCLEIRGLGIIDVRELYGVGAIRNKAVIELVISLEEWKENQRYDLLGLEEEKIEILEVVLPKLIIPVRPGRNLAVLVEAAALNHRLKTMGIHSAKKVDQELLNLLSKKQKPDRA